MASSQHVEVEAANFLHKLIQESKDEPAKLATKLYVICQHMKMSGKEQSLPYQVISRAMETVISQHGLDINVLKASRLPLASGPQVGDSTHTRLKDNDPPEASGGVGVPKKGQPVSVWHSASSSQTKEETFGGTIENFGMPKDSKAAPGAIGAGKHEGISSSRSNVLLNRLDSMGHDAVHQGSLSQRSNKSSEHESPASMQMEDSRSANSQDRRVAVKSDKQVPKKDNKKSNAKRKRADSKDSSEVHTDDLQQLDTVSTRSNSRKGKQINRGGMQGHFSVKGGENNSVQQNVHMEQPSPLSTSAGSLFRTKQESSQPLPEWTVDKTKSLNSFSAPHTSKHPEEGEVSSSHTVFGVQKGGILPSRPTVLSSVGVWHQNRLASPSQISQGSLPKLTEPPHHVSNETIASGTELKRNIPRAVNNGSQNSNLTTSNTDGAGRVSGGISGAFSSYATLRAGFPAPTYLSSSSFDGHDFASKMNKDRNLDASSASQLIEKGKDVLPAGADMDYSSVELGSSKASADSENRRHGFVKDAVPWVSEKVVEAQLSSSSRGADTLAYLSSGRILGHEGGTLHTGANSYKIFQDTGIQEQQNKDSASGKDHIVDQRDERFFPRPKLEATAKDMGGASGPEASVSANMPFKEQHLRQLRAQCLVFLAFRNNMIPRKLHLEIALGESYPKEVGIADGARKGPNDVSGKEMLSKEPGRGPEISNVFNRPNDIKETEKETSARIIPGSPSTGSLMETDSSSKDTENTKKKGKKSTNSDRSMMAEERQRASAFKRKPEAIHETAESQAMVTMPAESEFFSAGRGLSKIPHDKDSSDQANQQGRWANVASSSIFCSSNPLKPEGTTLTRTAFHNGGFKDTMNSMGQLQKESTPDSGVTPQNQFHLLNGSERVSKLFKPEFPILETNTLADRNPSTLPVKDQLAHIAGNEVENLKYTVNPPRDVNTCFTHVNQGEKLLAASEPTTSNSMVDAYCTARNNGLNDQKISNIQKQTGPDGFKTIIFSDSVKRGNLGTLMEKNAEQDEENKSECNDMPVSPPRFTTSEKWIIDQQKRRLLEEQNWALKQRKAEERITTCFDKLKENVSASEDISAKTRSVIELKKLQLLQLQRRLRSDFLNDFFKPISSDMERLKSVKKHRHGRRLKQLEKFEQKMKEERQKRIRERQKEFFGELEVHKEKLEDGFKFKRERWKGFNKYVKEFHKRKERTHREKIDRIQREKINLLKNNDVEGYLRMVQDAKSDRVKQLLKETEKYLQKLGSKLQEAKSVSRHFEMEMDDCQAATVVEKNEVSIDNEDESDQAQHYLESNEKYYLMAHSVKESINEQPPSLLGGKLREYQMNGLRWLASLYNNHLNGILADEMGLGKTVQVIALICYLMETKNDRGPFLVVVPSSVLPGWASEITSWAPGINTIAYFGPPEERRRLFKEMIVQQKFNVLLTTYEYLMNKFDRPKLSKVHWHYIIIDEGHRIKNASCKLNADLKHYQSSHRLLLTGTPLQNNLEELWALLNFLLPNIFNSAEDFSQWFNKPFESNGDNSPDEALLSEEENLLIINRLHQVLRPFVLRRLKHKVENELPEKIERLVRCEASAYQKLLIKRVEENLGSIGISKGRSVHNTVMELRNICNHPYLSQLHAEEVDTLIPKHYLPPFVRLCGKLEMLDRLLPKLKATDHRVLFFSTMTRLLDVMEEYLSWKRYRYLRLDGHTSGNDRGALIEEFNRPNSPAFIFLLSIRAGGVGVNLQAADTVIIFDTDWNPQVDLQAQARAHRIGQKRDVLVLRLETVHTVEEQVRAAAEHKLGVANQSITAGFFDNNTSAEDRREYLESLLRECKKEEVAPVLDDDALNDLLARSESEIDIFESVDKQRHEEEMAAWQRLVQGRIKDGLEPLPMPSRLVTDEDLKSLYQLMQISEVHNAGQKRKSEYLGNLDTQHYGRGKRAREVRSYEDQWTEEEFEKLCQADSPESPKPVEGFKDPCITKNSGGPMVGDIEGPPISLTEHQPTSKDSQFLSKEPLPTLKEPQPATRENSQPAKRGRGRPKRATVDVSPPLIVPSMPSETVSKQERGSQSENFPGSTAMAGPDSSVHTQGTIGNTQNESNRGSATASLPNPGPAVSLQAKGQIRKNQTGESPRGRGKKQISDSSLGVPVAQGRSRFNKKASTFSAPSVGYEVNLVSGLQGTDIPNVHGPGLSEGQEKSKRNSSAMDKKEIEKEVQVSESTEASLASGGSMYTIQGPGVIFSTLRSGQEKMSKSLVHVISPSVEDSKDRRALEVGSPKIVPNEKLKPAEQSDNISLQSSQKATPVCNPSLAEPPSSVTPEKANHMELPTIKSAEDTSKENMDFGKPPDLRSKGMKHETILVAGSSAQTDFLSVKENNMTAIVVKHGPEKKTSVTSKKAAARVTKKSSSSYSASERSAQQSGSKQLHRKQSISKGIAARVKGDNGGKQATPFTSVAVNNLEGANLESQVPSTLSSRRECPIGKEELLSQFDQQPNTSAVRGDAISLAEKDPANKEAEETKSMKLAAHGSNVNVTKGLQSCLNDAKTEGLINAAGLSQTHMEAAVSAEQTRVGSMDTTAPSSAEQTRVAAMDNAAPSEIECGNALSENRSIAVNHDSNVNVEPGKIKPCGGTSVHHSLEFVAPSSSERVCAIMNSTVEKSTTPNEENVTLSPCVIDAAHVPLDVAPTVQTCETKAKETALVESGGCFTSVEMVPRHPISLTPTTEFREKVKDVGESQELLVSGTVENSTVLSGGSHAISHGESFVKEDSCNERITFSVDGQTKSAQSHSFTGIPKLDLGTASLSSTHMPTHTLKAAESWPVESGETKNDPAFIQKGTGAVTINVDNSIAAQTLDQDVTREESVDSALSGSSSRLASSTARDSQISAEESGQPAEDLSSDFTESLSSLSRYSIVGGRSEESADNSVDRCGRKEETVATASICHTSLLNCDKSATSASVLDVHKTIEGAIEEQNVVCSVKEVAETGSTYGHAVSELSHGVETISTPDDSSVDASRTISNQKTDDHFNLRSEMICHVVPLQSKEVHDTEELSGTAKTVLSSNPDSPENHSLRATYDRNEDNNISVLETAEPISAVLCNPAPPEVKSLEATLNRKENIASVLEATQLVAAISSNPSSPEKRSLEDVNERDKDSTASVLEAPQLIAAMSCNPVSSESYSVEPAGERVDNSGVPVQEHMQSVAALPFDPAPPENQSLQTTCDRNGNKYGSDSEAAHAIAAMTCDSDLSENHSSETICNMSDEKNVSISDAAEPCVLASDAVKPSTSMTCDPALSEKHFSETICSMNEEKIASVSDVAEPVAVMFCIPANSVGPNAAIYDSTLSDNHSPDTNFYMNEEKNASETVAVVSCIPASDAVELVASMNCDQVLPENHSSETICNMNGEKNDSVPDAAEPVAVVSCIPATSDVVASIAVMTCGPAVSENRSSETICYMNEEKNASVSDATEPVAVVPCIPASSDAVEPIAAMNCDPALSENESSETICDTNEEKSASVSDAAEPVAVVFCIPSSPDNCSLIAECDRNEVNDDSVSKAAEPVAAISCGPEPALMVSDELAGEVAEFKDNSCRNCILFKGEASSEKIATHFEECHEVVGTAEISAAERFSVEVNLSEAEASSGKTLTHVEEDHHAAGTAEISVAETIDGFHINSRVAEVKLSEAEASSVKTLNHVEEDQQAAGDAEISAAEI